jgi:histidinol phosphatase-like PHP family hydrolase
VSQPRFSEQDFQRLELGRNNFPIIDLHTVMAEGATIGGLVEHWHATRIFAGVIANEGPGAPVSNNASAIAFLEETRSEPVLAGLKVGEPGWSERYPAKTLAMFDYLIADAAAPNGADQATEDPVDRVVAMIENLPIDIIANPLSGQGEDFWTKQRMGRIIDAAVQNGVAFEINTSKRAPLVAFVAQAKQAGAKFTIGTGPALDGDRDDWSYVLEVQKKLELSWRDMFVPGHTPNRAAGS